MSKLQPANLPAVVWVLVVVFFQSTAFGRELPTYCLDVSDYYTKRNDPQCTRDDEELGKRGLANLPYLSGVYCYNNGSGICKILAGKIEFYINSFTDTVIGPVQASQYVDKFGRHERVPFSYNIKGEVNYADRSINWAKTFVKSLEDSNRTINLLMSTDFNWCGYTEFDYWPYKSAIIDFKSKGRFHIYFSNRQSCIYDTKTKKRQQYNTRFIHRSRLRIDLDPNPVIFAMEDNISKNVHLVKQFRQHIREQSYNVLERPTSKVDFFVEISELKGPHKYDHPRPFLSKHAFDNLTDVCIHEQYSRKTDQAGSEKNSRVVPAFCGIEALETGFRLPIPRLPLYPIILHGIPRHPVPFTYMLELDSSPIEHWQEFAYDNMSFTALTAIPTNGDPNTYRLTYLAARYSWKEPEDPYDENYPVPHYGEYSTTYNASSETWRRIGEKKVLRSPYLNLVDDMEYLPQCDSVLIVFGPLYTEIPATSPLNVEAKHPIGSIDQLSLWEMTSAFFVFEKFLYVQHRANWLQKLSYTCGDKGALVTATRGKSYVYYPAYGPGSLEVTMLPTPYITTEFYEEINWKVFGVYKGSVKNPEAPDPANYPLGNQSPDGPAEESGKLWMYILIAIAVLIVIAMCIILLLTSRRRRRKQDNFSKLTGRSGISSSNSSSKPSLRSSNLVSNPTGLAKSRRSSRISGASSASRPQTSVRSLLHSSKPRSSLTRSQRSKALSSATSAPRASSRSSSRTSISHPSSSPTNKTSRSNLGRLSSSLSKHSRAPSTSKVASSKKVSKRPPLFT